ncbi:hypothetical protein [Stenomitos frigidus]|uniref:Uncharacterized protein n=1 Tax=Stenomitos frigidus ULC18 TaxID=2107698 RepID=A0A2T1DYC4_9CYAN|nr:hypothetical protein [Stenomitos frigidus]PSB25523.1 hypothetical protein C7B82_23160 [Stenomitos frigidus ULC18]
MKRFQNSLLAYCLVVGSGLLTGCNVEKARAIQGAATQFKAESLLAIQAIDDMRKQELEPPPRSTVEVRSDFVTGILNSRSDINAALIDLAIDPFKPPDDPQWKTFTADLRNQYENFAAIFDKLDAGNLLAVDDVRQSAEHAKTLTVQMALFADAVSKNPPVLYRYRNAIVVKLRKQRQAYQTLQAQVKTSYGSVEASPQASRDKLRDIENQVGEVMAEWQQVKLQEQKLLETTLAQCLKAAILGKELGQLVNRYDKLELNDINLLVPRILNTAAAISGRDFGFLSAKTASVIGEIKQDPLWQGAATLALDQVNTAVANRRKTTSAITVKK